MLLSLGWNHKGDPLEVALGAGDVGLPRPSHRHREALLLFQLREPEHRRLHDHRHVLEHVHHGGVHGVCLAHVGHRAVHCDGLGQQVDNEGRVVQLCFGDGLEAAAGDGPVGDLGVRDECMSLVLLSRLV